MQERSAISSWQEMLDSDGFELLWQQAGHHWNGHGVSVGSAVEVSYAA